MVYHYICLSGIYDLGLHDLRAINAFTTSSCQSQMEWTTLRNEHLAGLNHPADQNISNVGCIL